MKTEVFVGQEEAYVIKRLHEFYIAGVGSIDGVKNFTNSVAKLHGLSDDKDYILNMSTNELEEHIWRK